MSVAWPAAPVAGAVPVLHVRYYLIEQFVEPMSDIFIVRQPVFDRTDHAVGYELRFRNSEDGGDAFARSYLSGSFDVLRAGLPAHVRCTRAQLAEGIFASADPRTLVLVLPPDLTADEATVASVSALARSGVTICLDEFELPRTQLAPVLAFLPHAGMVRIDLRCHEPEAVGTLVAALRKQGKKVVADHVLDKRAHDSCLALGFERFQGPHFARPEPLPAAEIPTSTATALRLMALARDPDTPERELEKVISSDPSITFQLLRIVNSAAVGGRGITSIAHALRLVGRSAVVRWLALASATSRSGMSGVDDELVRQAVQRARLCESLGEATVGRDKGTLFLIGLFSLLDAVFRMPLHEVLERVNLADEVKAALLDRTGPYADALHVVEAYELGLWEAAAEACTNFGCDAALLPGMYAESLTWAIEQMPPTSRQGARVA